MLENLVCHELVSHGYTVTIGKNDEREIDFMAEREHNKIYIQVAAHIADRETADREFEAFWGIDDNYPKYVLTLDRDFLHNESGVMAKYLPEFVLSEL